MSEQEKDMVETVEAVEAVVSEEVTMENLIPDQSEPIITMKKLASAGVQYGHQTRKWNPKMAPYIYGAHNGIYIIDLKKTVSKIETAYASLKTIVEGGGTVLFVGTKNQVQELVKEQALRSGSFYINNRWLGGTLTNFKTIYSRVRYLKDLEKQEEDGLFDLMPKKEVSALRKIKDKLSRNLEGIKEVRRTPSALIVVDPMVDHTAVSEAKKLRIPVFGIIDTNADPDLVDYPIPGNDDAIGSVRILLQVLADAIVEAKGGVTDVAYVKDEEFLDRQAALKAEAKTRPEVEKIGATTRKEEIDAEPVVNPVKVEKGIAVVRKQKTSRADKPEVVNEEEVTTEEETEE